MRLQQLTGQNLWSLLSLFSLDLILKSNGKWYQESDVKAIIFYHIK